MKYTVVLLPEEDGGYSVICPALPGCISEGDSLKEALENVKEAAEFWLEEWLEDGYPIPVETPEVVAEEIILCLQDFAEDGLSPILETSVIELPSPVAM
ncbi:MAG: hypothetical protein HW403_1147 [Dehalococcoidia bacterium]|nr:hypothetical protein [Dehalococcoidia bacterium]